MATQNHTDDGTVTDNSEAAAELLRRHYESTGVVETCGRRGSVVWATTDDGGIHRANVADDYDTDVHLICETEQITADVGGDDAGRVFWNEVVFEVVDDPNGAALPTHATTTRGPTPRDDLPADLWALARKCGLDLPDPTDD